MVSNVSRMATLMGVFLVLGACTSTTEETTTTSFESVTTSTVAHETTTTTTVDDTTTTSVLQQLDPPVYDIVLRIPTDQGGDEVVVQLDPTSYQSLTDLDIYDIIAEVVEDDPPVSILHVVDSAEAAGVVANPEATAEDLAAIEDNYLAILEGNQITYLGPFASSGGATLGS